MTIAQAIALVDQQKPNQYTDADKIHWLNAIDSMIFREIISTHEDGVDHFDGYTEDTDQGTELLAEDGFSDMYIKWLYAQIDFANQETNRYSNSMIMFNALYADYGNAYNRAHMPKGTMIHGAGLKVRR